MKKLIILSIVIGLFLGSCKKFLTIYPETSLSGATFFKTEDDFEQAVNAAYQPLRSLYTSHAWFLEESHSDNTHYARNPLFGAEDNNENIEDFAVPTNNGITANTHIRDFYRLEYLIISRTNQILTTIDDVDFDANAKNNLKGQALFLRALSYFDLVRLFGKVPLHLTPVQSRQEAALPLASVDSLYDQIIVDASQAVKLLPPKSTQEPGRATSGAAKMLLANVYIELKKWPDAENLLEEIVNSHEYKLMSNYSDAFSTSTGNKNNMESVFEIQYKEGTGGYNNSLLLMLPRPMTADEVETITGVSNPQPLSEEGHNIPTPDIINAYEPGDKRKDVNIGYITLSTSLRNDKVFPYIKKYFKKHELQGNSGVDWPVYRYSEVLLFLAEALNEQGKSTEAATYLNKVRKRAGLAGTAATGEADMRKAIYHERRVELAFENKRWFDLVRTDRIKDVIVPFGDRMKAHPQDYYYPEGYAPHDNAFTNLAPHYALPADESAITPYF